MPPNGFLDVAPHAFYVMKLPSTYKQSIRLLAFEMHKTLDSLNPVFMRDCFLPKRIDYDFIPIIDKSIALFISISKK